METKNILVIGEFILDEFVLCKIDRFDPSGPFPVLLPQKTVQNPGGAGNTVANLKSLKGDYDLNVHFLRPFETIVKTRYVCEKTNHKICRVDTFDSLPENEKLCSSEQLINYCNSNGINFSKLSCVVFSEYAKGFLTKNFINEVTQIAKLYNIPVFLDTKFDLGEWSKDVFCVKINEKEYLNSDKLNTIPEKYCQNLIVTTGGNGAKWFNNTLPSMPAKNFPLDKKVEVAEFCGLGDLSHASIVIKYLETGDLEESIKWANKVCSYKATKKGIFAVKREEIV